MASVVNVTFDSKDPRVLAGFWAAATGYEMVDSRADFVRLRAPDSRSVRHLLFFRVPEPKLVKNRVHIDLAAPEPQAEIDRLLELGAELVDGPDVVWRTGNGTRWVVMTDPEGNEFCIG